MKPPHNPLDEAARLSDLRSYEILDTGPEASFDGLTRLASQLLQMPIALVSLVDDDRTWFKARVGLSASETPRAISFCSHVVADAVAVEVEDAARDPRFADSPLVTGEPKVGFYLGVPLRSPRGHVLGAFCVIDHRPRELTGEQREMLQLLAAQASDALEQRRQGKALLIEHEALQRSEANLRRSEARLSAVFEAMAEGVVQQDRQGVITNCNAAAERILGLTREQMLGLASDDPRWRPMHEDGSPMSGDQHPSMITLRTGKPCTDVPVRIDLPSGQRRLVSVNSRPLFAAEGGLPDAVLVTFRDVTNERAAAATLATERAFLEALIGNLPSTSVAIFDQELRLRRLFGVQSRPEMRDSTVIGKLLAEIAWPATRDQFLAAAQRCLLGENSQIDATREGRRFEVKMVPLPAGDASVHVMILTSDITERELLRERAARQERLATMGTLAAGVGHEINNPLASLMGNLEFAIDELRAPAAGSPVSPGALVEALTDALESGERIKIIVRGLRTLAGEEGAVGAVELSSVLELARSIAGHEVRRRARLSIEIDAAGQVPRVRADEGPLTQVFVNLIVNAAQAFLASDPARNRIALRASRSPDGRALVTISDNGPGIAPEVLPRVFDPFFTTRPIGQGAGLGLSVSRGIITGLGGEIGCESTPGEGTTFRVLLPSA